MTQTETSINRAVLRGVAEGEAKPSHVNHGVNYYIFPLAVSRLSGARDLLNVVIPEDLLEACPLVPGGEYEVGGEIRSFNNRSGSGARLVITFFARTLAPAEGEHLNRLELGGVLCKPPTLRRTPLGREICDLLLAVNRRYGRADYLPCIAWGQVAMITGNMSVGEALSLEGRVQSRAYTKVVEGCAQERTAFEVSVMHLVEE